MYGDLQSQPVRVVTIGDTSVGKTSITNRLVENRFNETENSTVGANYQPFTVEENGEKIDMQIWDTAGQEKYKSLSPIYFRNASAAVVVFSLTNQLSFERVSDWINSFVEVAGANALIYIVANKSDLVNQITVSPEAAREWSRSNGYSFFITSAMTGDGVQEVFRSLAAELIEKGKNTRVNPSSTLSKKEDSSKCC